MQILEKFEIQTLISFLNSIFNLYWILILHKKRIKRCQPHKIIIDFAEKIAYPITEKKNLIRPLSVIKLKNEKGTIIPVEFFESYGTIRLLDILPIILGAMKTGATLFMNELDASIHPMVVMSIIKMVLN